MLDDWNDLLKIAFKVVTYKGERNKVWELRERVVPRLLNSYEENEWLVARVLYNKIDKKDYIDLRIFKKVLRDESKEGENQYKMVRTNRGILLPVSVWQSHVDIILKLLVKYT